MKTATRPIHPDWKAVRFVHLLGGCRAHNGLDPEVTIEPAASNGKLWKITLSNYHALIPALMKDERLVVVGAEYLTRPEQFDGREPTEWRAYQGFGRGGWALEETAQKWVEVGHGAFNAKEGYVRDIAHRISHQLRLCNWRLYEISEAYRRQLHSATNRKEFVPGQRFVDGFTWFGYWSLQSFLVDACILRDYISEFYAATIDPDTIPKKPVLTKSSVLKKKILDRLEKPYDKLTEKLVLSTADGGWLHRLGQYRDLVVHSAPLANARQRLLAVPKAFEFHDGAYLPMIEFPLPRDPGGEHSARASGRMFENPDDLYERFKAAMEGSSPTEDGLYYAHATLKVLVDLARDLIKRSPIAPEKITITEEWLREVSGRDHP